MNEYMMIFRNDYSPEFKPSPEQMQASIKQWQDWIGGIASQQKFVETNRLGFQGKTLHADKTITDGPYAEVKEIIGGYIIVKSDDLSSALALAEGCPILSIGGSVEVRDIIVLPK
jgi:hypothetical protein